MRTLITSAPALLLPLLVVTLGQAPLAVAGTPADTLAAARLAREACDKDLPAQQQRLSSAPTDRALSFAVADCLYENGRYQVAREALDAAWRGADAAAFRPLGARGAEALALYAILLAHGQRAGEARALLEGARKAVGADPHLQRAAVLVRAYGGDRPGAWAELGALRQGAPDELAYLRATAELASLDPDGITPAAREVLAVRSSPDTRFNRAARHLNDRAPRACVEVVRQSLPELPEAERPRFRTLGYTCAVQAEDLGAATALLKEVGPQQARGLPSSAVIGHARLIADAGDMGTAVKLLGLTQPADADERGLAQTIRVRAATEAGDLSGALAAAASGEASPASMANLARALVTAGRIPEAEPLLDKACPQLKGEAAGQCYGYVEWMKRQKAKTAPPKP